MNPPLCVGAVIDHICQVRCLDTAPYGLHTELRTGGSPIPMKMHFGMGRVAVDYSRILFIEMQFIDRPSASGPQLVYLEGTKRFHFMLFRLMFTLTLQFCEKGHVIDDWDANFELNNRDF